MAEEKINKKFSKKIKKSLDDFIDEVSKLKTQHNVLKKDQFLLIRALKRMQKMTMSSEFLLTRMKICLRTCDIEALYDTLKIEMPKQL